MRYLVFLYVFILTIGSVHAQNTREGRYEIEMAYNDEYFTVVPAGEKGILIYREVRNKDTKMENKWQVILLDTTLNVVWEKHYYIDQKYANKGYEYFGDYFYLLFIENNESPKADLIVMRINLTSQNPELFEIKREYPMELTEFEILDDGLIFGGYSNDLPTLVYYKFGTDKPKVLPGFFSKRGELQHLDIDSTFSQFNVLTSFRTNDGRESLTFSSFDKTGEMLQNVSLKPSEGHNLLFGRVITIENDIHLIVGTYARRKSEYSQGVFLARISSEGDQIINYYNYADLQNFFNFMKAKRQRRVEERIERRKIKGKKNKFNYRLLVQDIIEKDGKFIMIGEAFYPKYGQTGFYDGYMPYYSNNFNTLLEGYNFTHAVVIGFDRRGQIIWDNSFEINDIFSYNLQPNVNVTVNNDRIILMYMYENVIRTKIIEDEEVVEGKAFNENSFLFENEIIENEDDEYGGLKSWYGDVNFGYGVHKIRKKYQEEGSNNREVFFINKIRYE